MKYEEHFKALQRSDAYASQNALSLALACQLSYASESVIKKCVEITWGYDFLAVVSRKIWVTEHSLGGALCSLFAGMLLENRIDVYAINTFASPRPGNAKFASKLNEKVKAPHWRIVNSGDLVPHLHPEPFFSHPGNRIILKHNHKKRTKGSWLDERIAALKNFVDMTGKRFDVANNHRLIEGDDSYVPRLIADLARQERRKKR